MSLTAYAKNKLSDYKDCLKELRFDESTSKGRLKTEDEDYKYYDVTSPLHLDIVKLLECKAIRRQEDLTQVHEERINRHIRNRRSHTDGVQAVGILISDITGLNTYLVQSGSILHDLGHVSYGHTGEDLINDRMKKKINPNIKFHHALNSLIVAEFVERKGKGLNLTYETLECALLHSRSFGKLYTSGVAEYDVVMYADKISYVFSDFNDAIRKNLITKKQNPELFALYEQIGTNQRSCTLKCITELCKESKEEKAISFSKSKTAKNFNELLHLMYDQVYHTINWAIQKDRIEKILDILESATIDDYNQILKTQNQNLPNPYMVISLLTDNYVTNLFEPSIKMNKLAKMELIDISKMIIDYTNHTINLNDLLTKTNLETKINLDELIPSLMTHKYDFNELFIKYGENNPNFFSEVLVPAIKKY